MNGAACLEFAMDVTAKTTFNMDEQLRFVAHLIAEQTR
jgi:hypothetical protein